MCFVGNEEPDLYEEKWRRARKPHRCIECGEPIPAGTTYLYAKSLFWGDWSDWKTCRSCYSLREAVIDHEEADGCTGVETFPPVGELWASAEEAEIISYVDPELRAV